MTTHKPEELIAAVRALPPSSPEVVKRFAHQIIADTTLDGMISGKAVRKIVMAWPGASQDCKNRFLKDNGVASKDQRKYGKTTVHLDENDVVTSVVFKNGDGGGDVDLSFKAQGSGKGQNNPWIAVAINNRSRSKAGTTHENLGSGRFFIYADEIVPLLRELGLFVEQARAGRGVS